MRKIRYNFLFVIGLMLIFGTATTVFSQNKQAKNSGILTVKTSPASYPVRVDGQVIGMSGVGSEAVFYLTPGEHTVEVEGPSGQKFSKTITFVKGQKHCICLKVLETTTKRPCPYDIYVQGPDEKVKEGTVIYFKAMNRVTVGAIPVNYRWSVSPSTVNFNGQGTDTISIDTTGLGDRTVTATLVVTDGVYDANCQQNDDASASIEKIIIEPPKPFQCSIFETRRRDEDKANFDNCVIQLQNYPDAQLYLIFYQGTDRRSRTVNSVVKLQPVYLDYLVRTRGVDPSRIVMVRGSNKPKTVVEIWIVPPGAQPPVPQ